VSAVITSILAMSYTAIAQAILTGGGCIWVTRLLTSAEVNTLNTIPIAIMSAVGLPAGTVIQSLYSVMQQRVGAAIYSGAPSFRGRWAGIAVDVCMVDGMTNTAGLYIYFYNLSVAISSGVVLNPNRDFEMSAVANTTLGSGTVRQVLGLQLVAAL